MPPSVLIIVSSTFFGTPNNKVYEMTLFIKDRLVHKTHQTAITSGGSKNEK